MPANGLPNVGERVKLLRPHLWADRTGVVIRRESWMGKPSVVVELDGGEKNVGLARPEQWTYADA